MLNIKSLIFVYVLSEAKTNNFFGSHQNIGYIYSNLPGFFTFQGIIKVNKTLRINGSLSIDTSIIYVFEIKIRGFYFKSLYFTRTL